MKVYLLECGVYEDRYVKGVFSSSEKAMAAWHPAPGPASGNKFSANEPGPYQWRKDDEDSWTFDADYYDSASIIERTVDES